MTKIKICGLFREEDIEYVNITRPDYIGFILNFPKSHRNIDIEQAKMLKDILDPKIKAVGVFINADIEYINEICQENIIDIIQLHGSETNEYIEKLKKITNKKIIKVFKIRFESDIDFKNKKDKILENINNSLADMILIDTGMGEGIEHSKFNLKFLKEIKKEFILAGGINLENIKDILTDLKNTKLSVIDVSSGVETDKIKDFYKISKLINLINQTLLI